MSKYINEEPDTIEIASPEIPINFDTTQGYTQNTVLYDELNLTGTKTKTSSYSYINSFAGLSPYASASTEVITNNLRTNTLEPSEELPVKNWDRYEIVSLLGKGGMGQVYRAKDLRLNRFVALKFIRGRSSKLLERFTREAQAQARVDHPHICKVYEVGEVEGMPYIAMQLIEGQPLKQLSRSLTLPEKLLIIKNIAEAIHAAHKIGLIHRDVKPSNILIERDEDGRIHPYIMDFGLAREMQGAVMTKTGVLVGTPLYMSPEQIAWAFGEKRPLSQQIDIYGLGATLYELLAGEPPFTSGSTKDLLIRIMEEEPISLEYLAPTLPDGLAAKVMKCLDKMPENRYSSAKVFAETLEEYLVNISNSLITSKIASIEKDLVFPTQKEIIAPRFLTENLITDIKPSHKISKKTFFLAAIVIILLGIFTVGIIRQFYIQEQITKQYNQETEKIVNTMKMAYLAPMHDIQREKTTFIEKLKILEQEISKKPIANGEQNYTIARSYLAMQEYQKAQENLEIAWQKGYQGSEVEYCLGLVLGQIYLRSLESTELIVDTNDRETIKKQLEKKYRDRIISHLQSAQKSKIEEATYIEALIAFYQSRYDESLSKAQLAFNKSPLLYQAKILIGDNYVAKGKEKLEKKDLTGSRQDFEKAGQEYLAVMTVAHSDWSVYEKETERCLQLVKLAFYQDCYFQEALLQAINASNKALQVDSLNVSSYSKKAQIYSCLGEYELKHKKDPTKAFNQSIEICEKILTINAQYKDAYNLLGDSFLRKAKYETEHGNNSSKNINEAIKNFQKAAQL